MIGLAFDPGSICATASLGSGLGSAELGCGETEAPARHDRAQPIPSEVAPATSAPMPSCLVKEALISFAMALDSHAGTPPVEQLPVGCAGRTARPQVGSAFMIAKPTYLRTTQLIKRLKIPGPTPESRKRKSYALCSTLGLRELGRREGRGEWLFPVEQVEQRYHDHLLQLLR